MTLKVSNNDTSRYLRRPRNGREIGLEINSGEMHHPPICSPGKRKRLGMLRTLNQGDSDDECMSNAGVFRLDNGGRENTDNGEFDEISANNCPVYPKSPRAFGDPARVNDLDTNLNHPPDDLQLHVVVRPIATHARVRCTSSPCFGSSGTFGSACTQRRTVFGVPSAVNATPWRQTVDATCSKEQALNTASCMPGIESEGPTEPSSHRRRLFSPTFGESGNTTVHNSLTPTRQNTNAMTVVRPYCPWRTPCAPKMASPSSRKSPSEDCGSSFTAISKRRIEGGSKVASVRSWSSEDTTQSATPFHFSTFPASLPRVFPKPIRKESPFVSASPQFRSKLESDFSKSPAALGGKLESAQMSLRKRMSSSSDFKPVISDGCSERATVVGPSAFNQPSPFRSGDTSHDHSLSSISSDSPAGRSIHNARCESSRPCAIIEVPENTDIAIPPKVPVTRLNFNSLLTPESKEQGLKSTVIPLCKIDFKRVMSSDTETYHSPPLEKTENGEIQNLKNVTDFGNINLGCDTWPKRNSICGSVNLNESLESELTSHERFECQLEASQFSPIRRQSESFASLSPSDTSSMGPPSTSESVPRTQIDLFKPKTTHEDAIVQISGTGNGSFSASTASSSSGKSRKARPMPDMTAFDGSRKEGISSSHDGGYQDRSMASGSTLDVVCPPTPERTPAWALSVNHLPVHLRGDSLTSSKILAACSLSLSDQSLYDSGNDTITSLLHISAGDQRRGLRQVSHDSSYIGRTFVSRSDKESLSIRGYDEVGASISFESDFEILGQLGSGAFADVYKVRCKEDNILYAVKRSRRQFRSRRDRERTLEEVRIMQRFQVCGSKGSDGATFSLLPNILRFFRAWQEDGHFFSQTELCCRDNCGHMMTSLFKEWSTAKKRYPSLQRNLPKSIRGSDPPGRLVPESSIWKICHDVVSGLAHIHSYDIVHHDIKPSNIFFVAHEELGCICKIGDFGMAGESGTSEDGQEGDTTYMPLELLSSGLKQSRSDMFSLGLMLYELASDYTWELPVEGPGWHAIRSEQHQPVLPSCRSAELFELISVLISPIMSARPSSLSILDKIRPVQNAKSLRDSFLGDYVSDVCEFDVMRERRLAAAHKAAAESRVTPTAAILGNYGAFLPERVTGVRTPTPDGQMEFVSGRSMRK